MAAYNKFECFVGDLAGGVHDLSGNSDGDLLKVYLSNAAPSASGDTVKADLAEISNENGYTAPEDVQNDGNEASGTFTLTGVSLTITAAGGTVGPFRYVALYNDTAANDPLIAWWDYGSEVTLQAGESFSIKFNNADVGNAGNIFTLA